jgi:hypothetical protein
MSLLLSIPKTFGGPGSLGFLLAAAVVCLAIGIRWPAHRRRVAAAAGLVIASYIFLALPVVAHAIVDALPPLPPIDAGATRQAQSLVVFDGDNLLGRARAARRVLRQSSPREVWLLGADYLLADLRVAVGPTTTLHYDGATWNTSAQVEQVRHIARRWPPMTTAVVASRIQMPRVARLLEAVQTPVLLIPSSLDREPATSGAAVFVPSLAALAASREAIYEHAALVYYRWRGDLR